MEVTANLRIVNKTRIMNVIRAVLINARLAPPIRWINRWPAVILAVGRIANAMGWMDKLMVSIITNTGLSGTGVPWGRKWAGDALVLLRKPVSTVPAHKGITIPRVVDSCVVGLNERGRSPSRFVVPVAIIRHISTSVHVCPLWLWTAIICFELVIVG